MRLRFSQTRKDNSSIDQEFTRNVQKTLFFYRLKNNINNANQLQIKIDSLKKSRQQTELKAFANQINRQKMKL